MDKRIPTLLFLVVLTIVSACTGDPSSQLKQKVSIAQLSISEVSLYNSRFPAGTHLEEIGTALHWTLPTGYSGIDVNSDGDTRLVGGMGTLTCTCVQGSEGCSPAHSSDGSWFCIQPPECATCNSTLSAVTADDTISSLIFVKTGHFSFVNSIEDVRELRLAPEAVLTFDTFSRALSDFLAPFAGDEGSARETVLLDAWGLLVLANVESGSVPMALITGAGKSCKCDSGDSGCSLVEGKNVDYCRASDCMSCSLTASAISPSGEVVELQFSPSGYLKQ